MLGVPIPAIGDMARSCTLMTERLECQAIFPWDTRGEVRRRKRNKVQGGFS